MTVRGSLRLLLVTAALLTEGLAIAAPAAVPATTPTAVPSAPQAIAAAGVDSTTAATGRDTPTDRPAAEPVAAPVSRIARQAGACTTCHGAEGRATASGYFPRIAGKPVGYLYEQLLNFRDGRRQQLQMQHLLENLTDRYLLEFAEYFAGLKLPYPPPEAIAGLSPALLARGEHLVREGDPARQLPACAGCHGDQLSGLEPGVPGLLGLSRDYLNAQIGAWRIGQRHAKAPDCMATIAQRLQPEDVSALTAWLARQPVPADYAPRLP